MISKLNGWQRLWVLVSIVLLIAFVVFAYIKRPHGLDEFPAACNDIANRLIKEWERNNVKTPKTREESIYTRQFKLETPYTMSGLYYYPAFRSCADKELLYQQITFVIKVLSVWLASIIFIYGAGISVVWVRNGFRQKKKNK